MLIELVELVESQVDAVEVDEADEAVDFVKDLIDSDIFFIKIDFLMLDVVVVDSIASIGFLSLFTFHRIQSFDNFKLFFFLLFPLFVYKVI